jgi:DNA-binding beta-propeller fold protein YncE
VALKLLGYVDLPSHIQSGCFDHAAVHTRLNRCYVAHTANDAVDVIDCLSDRFTHSIPDLTGVAGALVSEESNLVFTSNRGENTVSVFVPEDETGLIKISVGVRPNGLSYDPQSGLLLSAHVGEPTIPDSTTISLLNVQKRQVVTDIAVPGRTRWTVFDRATNAFYVNITDPSMIVVVDASNPSQVARSIHIPVAGPHGLDIDPLTNRLFCACDAGTLVTVDTRTGKILTQSTISGTPDVIFYNAELKHLYIAIGDPGVIDVFDTLTMETVETIITERGAHTLAFDPVRNKVYAFLPETHRAAVYTDRQSVL